MFSPALLESALTFKVADFKDVRKSLRGRVFHVTRLSSVSSILAAGGLLPNRFGFKSPLGDNADSYFRAIGCVSFFDYRGHKSKEWRKFHRECYPTRVIHHDDPAVVMFLSPEHHANLIDWTGWKIEGRREQSVVPYVEVGFPGQVDNSMITEVRIWEHANPELGRFLELMDQRGWELQSRAPTPLSS